MKQNIYQFLNKIPKGKVISYKILAEYFNTSPRAIGKIMKNNKEPDRFPCYKVIRCDGYIWGYNWWVEEKIKRLTADTINIINNKISTEYFRYPKNPSLKKKKK